MLKKLLYLAAGQGTTRITELASELGVSTVLVQEMLEDLTRQDYIAAVVPACLIPCERCPLSTACLFQNQPRIWALTQKGEQFLAISLKKK